MLTIARVLTGTVMAGFALTALGACSQGHHPDPTAADPSAARAAGAASAIPTESTAAATSAAATVAPSAATSAPAERSSPAARQVPLKPAPLPSLSAVPAVEAGFAEACTPAALLAYVKKQRPVNRFDEVKIYNCVGGYAHLYAVAGPASSGERTGGDQFYLRYSDGHWQTLARGVGIGCGDGMAVLARACAVFEFAATH